jgi:hypothetical protein
MPVWPTTPSRIVGLKPYGFPDFEKLLLLRQGHNTAKLKCAVGKMMLFLGNYSTPRVLAGDPTVPEQADGDIEEHKRDIMLRHFGV